MKKILIILTVLIIHLSYGQVKSKSFIAVEGGIGKDITLIINKFQYAKELKVSKIEVYSDEDFVSLVKEGYNAGLAEIKIIKEKNNDYYATFSNKINFSAPGKYYIRVSFSALSQDGEKSSPVRYWTVNVTKPTLYSPFIWKEKFIYPGNYSFSFAFNGCDYNELTYKIFDQNNTEIVNQKGAHVVLDSILNNAANVGKGFTILGYYKGKEFNYYQDMNSKETSPSKWNFVLAKPDLVDINSFWINSDKFDPTSKMAIDLTIQTLISPLDFNFYYVSAIDKENGINIYSFPEFDEVRITSKTPNFLENSALNYEKFTGKIRIKINPKFYENIKSGERKKVDVTISFTTQFNEYFLKEYNTFVVKPFGMK